MASEQERLLIRLRAYYFFAYGAAGWLFPQLSIFIERIVGMKRVGAVMAIFPLVSLAAAPLWGALADRYRIGTRLLMASTALMGLAVLLYAYAEGLWSLMAITGALALMRASEAPLADALVHVGLEGAHHRFSRSRMWGSIGFVTFAGIGGALGGVDVGRFYLITPAIAYLLATVSVTGAFDPREAWKAPSLRREVFSVLRRPAMWRALVGLGVYYSAHALFDAYFGLHVAALGHPPGLASLAWGFGAAVEIAVMLLAPALLVRVAGRRLLAPVALVAVLRWWLTSVVVDPVALFFVQGLHGISFGLWFLAMINHLQGEAPQTLRASVQGFSTTVWGAAQLTGYGLGGVLLARGPTAALYRWGAVITSVAALVFLLVPSGQAEARKEMPT